MKLLALYLDYLLKFSDWLGNQVIGLLVSLVKGVVWIGEFVYSLPGKLIGILSRNPSSTRKSARKKRKKTPRKNKYVEAIFNKLPPKLQEALSPYRHPKGVAFLVSLVVVIVLLPIAFFTINNPGDARAGWWNDHWSYRKRVDVTNGGSDLTNFQVSFTLDTASLISNGKMQSDCDDIRITDHNGTELPHWIEENNPGCNDASTKIWTKVPDIPSSNGYIYVYYGNDTATNSENGNDVFEFFDDFSNGSLNENKWTATGGYSISSGEISITTGSVYTNSTVASSAQDLIYEHRTKWTTTSGSYSGLEIADAQSTQGSNNGSNALVYLMTSAATNLNVVSYGADGTSASYNIIGGATEFTATQDVYTVAGFSIDASNVAYYNNRSQTNSYSGTWSDAPYLWLGYFSGSAASTTNGKDMTTDWVLVRQYASSEPTTSLDSEEVGPGPIAEWKFDEGGGTTVSDNTQQGKDLTLNDATWQNEDMCISGNCLSFDGTDDYLSGQSDVLPDEYTVSMWVRPQGGGYAFWESETQLNFTGGNTFSYRHWTGTSYTLSSNSDKELNKWYFVTITHDTTDGLKMYVNGELEDSDASATDSANDGAFQIGKDETTSYFNGFLDEFKVYPYARTADEIKADFIEGAASAGSQAVIGRSDTSYLSEGLVGYWKMDDNGVDAEGETTTDSSGNGNDGTLNGDDGTGDNGSGMDCTAAGKYGTGCEFDGVDDYVDVPTQTFSGEYTASLWWKVASHDTNHRFAFSDDDSGTTTKIGQNNDGSNFFVRAADGGSSDTSVSLPSTGEWHHIVVTRDANNKVDLYIDGEKSRLFSDAAQSGDAIFEAIGSATGSNQYWDGNIDEVRIYNRALSSSEVSGLYEWAPKPVAHWTFDEGSGTTAQDISGSGFDGDITGAEWVAGKYGKALSFNGADYVDIPSPDFPGIKNQVSVSFWQYGDPNIQPQNDYIFEGRDSSDNRVISTHLPWSNGNIYWDAGDDGAGGYDRISKAATDSEYEGQWNHWVLVKNATTGESKMYLNGQLWHSGTGLTNTMSELGTFKIGSGYAGTGNYYDGYIDDVRIYNYELEPQQIVESMNADHPAPGSPVGSALSHWRFDEGYSSTAYDSGLDGSNGTIDGATWTSDGRFGKALDFDGTDDVVTTPLTPPKLITVSAWIKIDSYPPGSSPDSNGFILRNGNAIYFFVGSSGRVNFQMYNSGANTLTSTFSLNTDEWYHVAGSWDGTTSSDSQKLYINGELNNSNAAFATTYGSTTNTFTIGAQSTSWNHFDGLIDDVKIYNSVLTTDQIKQDMNQGQSTVFGATSTESDGSIPSRSASREYCIPGDSTTCSPPIAEWKLDENTGSSANDTSGNGSTGTISGASWSPGKISSGLQFDGADDYVSVTDNDTLDLNEFTIEGWVYRRSASGDSSETILKKNEDWILRMDDDGTLQGYNWDGNGRRIDYSSTDAVSTGEWTHVAFVMPSTTSEAKFYINGIEANISHSNISASRVTTNDLEIGGVSGGNEQLDGKLDNLRVYDYARTPAQIAWDYNRGKPVGHWRLDQCQGTTAYDSSGHDNHGTITIGGTGTQTSAGTCESSGTAWGNGAEGKLNASLSFDEVDDYVDISEDDMFDMDGNLTLSAWVKPNSVGNNSVGGCIIGKIYASETTYSIRYPSTGKLMFRGNDGSTYVTHNSNTTLSNNEWQHVVATYDKSNLNMYINGRLDYSSAESASLRTDQDSGVNIGRCNNTDRYFDGQIDDARIYNYALTENQVQTLFNSGGAVRFGQ